MWIDGRPISGGGDCIIGMNCRDFYNAGITETKMSIDHRMILADLKGGGVIRNRRY